MESPHLWSDLHSFSSLCSCIYPSAFIRAFTAHIRLQQTSNRIVSSKHFSKLKTVP